MTTPSSPVDSIAKAMEGVDEARLAIHGGGNGNGAATGTKGCAE